MTRWSRLSKQTELHRVAASDKNDPKGLSGGFDDLGETGGLHDDERHLPLHLMNTEILGEPIEVLVEQEPSSTSRVS
jgi:hypothetical protein